MATLITNAFLIETIANRHSGEKANVKKNYFYRYDVRADRDRLLESEKALALRTLLAGLSMFVAAVCTW
jgi:hypothetical protein